MSPQASPALSRLDHAHQIAVRAEDAVKAAGISWGAYQSLMKKHEKPIEEEKLIRVPPISIWDDQIIFCAIERQPAPEELAAKIVKNGFSAAVRAVQQQHGIRLAVLQLRVHLSRKGAHSRQDTTQKAGCVSIIAGSGDIFG